jgi:hypothetical protein
MTIKLPVVKKLLAVVLLLTVTCTSSSDARNDQKGGHGGGGHAVSSGGGPRQAGGGHAPSHVAPSHVAPSHVAPSHVAPSHVAPSHVAEGGHIAKPGPTGSVSANREPSRSSPYRSNAVGSATRQNPVAHASRQATAGQNQSIAAGGLNSQHSAQVYATSGAQRSNNRANPGTASSVTDPAWSKNRSPQWHQAVANRQQYWNRWTNDNRAQLQRFQSTRGQQWNQIAHWWNGRNVPQTMHSDPSWNTFRNNVMNFRDERRMEVWNSASWQYDHLFDDRWWAGCGWYPSVAVVYWNPWWWWTPCDWISFSVFLGWGTVAPVYYDPGVNWVDAGQVEYYDGEPIGSTADCADWAARLADPPNPSAPTPPEDGQPADWKPLGVWALTQEEKGDAFMFLQLSVNKGGVISGAFSDVLTGEKEPVTGEIDKVTQRAAFHFGNNKTTIIETGAYDLTQDVASCFVRFGTAPPQTWLLVRLPAPTMPSTPSPISQR